MLYLVGLGFETFDLSLKAVEILKKADKIYFETYTNDWKGDIKEIEKIVGKSIEKLERSDIEENISRYLEKDKNIAILVPGDPLVATTHTTIILEAKKLGIKTKIIHAPSIFSAISVTGLQLYKFGKTATVPWTEQISNVEETIRNNKNLGLHTLLLLDINMNGEEGLEILMKKGIVKSDEKIVIASRIGLEDEKILYGSSYKLKEENFPSPSVIIIPGNLHFAEKEFLELYEV